MRALTASLAKVSAAVLIAATVATGPAAAKCARLSFLVNDYGKTGPTNDAKSLLDKHIAKWTAAHGVTKYTAGKKDVTCELFLDFGVFDEHTCTASATVCWGDGGGGPVKANAAPADGVPTKPKPAPAKVKAETEKPAPAKAKTASPAKAKADKPAADSGDAPAAPAATPADGLQAPAPAKLKPKAT